MTFFFSRKLPETIYQIGIMELIRKMNWPLPLQMDCRYVGLPQRDSKKLIFSEEVDWE